MSESQRDANLGIPPDLERQDPLAYEKRLRETRELLENGLIEDDTPGLIKGGLPRERHSITRILGYKPREGCDLCLRVFDGQDNLSQAVALSLYQAYSRDCRKLQVRRVVFRPNLTYEFSNGLVFRLFLETGGPPDIYLPIDAVTRHYGDADEKADKTYIERGGSFKAFCVSLLTPEP